MSVLNVPAAVPAKVRRDRWGRYLVVPPTGGREVGYTRVTTVAKTLDDGGGLTPWKATTVAVGMLRRPGLLGRWQALVAEHPDPWYASEASKADCKALVEECSTAGGSTDRRDLGTAIHALTERVDRGEPVDSVTPAVRADLDAYRATIEAAGIVFDVDLIETIVILDEFQVAGTVDRLSAVLPDGRRVVADIKTGASLDFGQQAIAVQLACYARADHRYRQLGRGGERLPMPEGLDPDTGLVIHLPAGEARCELHFVDLAAGWEAFERSMWVRGWRKRRDLFTPFTSPTPAPTGSSSPGVDGARRERLLRVFREQMTANEQDRFRALGVDPADLDAVDAALTQVMGFASTAPAPAVRDTPTAEVVEAVDEGDDVDEATAQALRDGFARLDAAQRAWVWSVTAEASAAGGSLSLATRPSVRRFDIGRSLVAVASEYVFGDDTTADRQTVDGIVRAAASVALGDELAESIGVRLGALLAAMDAGEARQFAEAVADLIEGRRLLIFSDDGRPRLAVA